MELPSMELQKPRGCLPFLPWNQFEQHVNKYGNKEWINYKELKQTIEKIEDTRVIGYISPETGKKWKGEDWGKLYVVSYYKNLMFFLPSGVVLY